MALKSSQVNNDGGIDYSFIKEFSEVHPDQLLFFDFYHEEETGTGVVNGKGRGHEGEKLVNGVILAKEIMEQIISKGGQMLWENELAKKGMGFIYTKCHEFVEKALFSNEFQVQSAPNQTNYTKDSEPVGHFARG